MKIKSIFFITFFLLFVFRNFESRCAAVREELASSEGGLKKFANGMEGAYPDQNARPVSQTIVLQSSAPYSLNSSYHSPPTVPYSQSNQNFLSSSVPLMQYRGQYVQSQPTVHIENQLELQQAIAREQAELQRLNQQQAAQEDEVFKKDLQQHSLVPTDSKNPIMVRGIYVGEKFVVPTDSGIPSIDLTGFVSVSEQGSSTTKYKLGASECVDDRSLNTLIDLTCTNAKTDFEDNKTKQKMLIKLKKEETEQHRMFTGKGNAIYQAILTSRQFKLNGLVYTTERENTCARCSNHLVCSQRRLQSHYSLPFRGTSWFGCREQKGAVQQCEWQDNFPGARATQLPRRDTFLTLEKPVISDRGRKVLWLSGAAALTGLVYGGLKCFNAFNNRKS